MIFDDKFKGEPSLEEFYELGEKKMAACCSLNFYHGFCEHEMIKREKKMDNQYALPEKESEANDYIVIADPYNPKLGEGLFNTKRRTYTFEKAKNVAESLAAQKPGINFYVAKLIGRTRVANTIYEEL